MSAVSGFFQNFVTFLVMYTSEILIVVVTAALVAFFASLHSYKNTRKRIRRIETCPECGHFPMDAVDLPEHLRRKHPTYQKILICRKCGCERYLKSRKVFYRRNTMRFLTADFAVVALVSTVLLAVSYFL